MPQRPGTLSTGRGNDFRNGTDETPCRPKAWPSHHGGAKRKVASDSLFEDLGDKYVKRYAGSILRKRPESSELRFPTFEAPAKDAIRKHEAFFISAGNARKAPSSFLHSSGSLYQAGCRYRAKPVRKSVSKKNPRQDGWCRGADQFEPNRISSMAFLNSSRPMAP